jgi:hypothetical protein
MSARVILFPQRAPLVVRVEREGPAWLVTCRNHGWLHGDRSAAIADANTIARGFGVVISHPPIQQNSRKRMRSRLVQMRSQYPHRNCHERKPAMTTVDDDFDTMYGSKYFSVPDLKGQRPRRTIGKVEVAELKEKDGSTKRKRILYLEGEDKPLVLNKTNAVKLAMAFGKDSSEWINARVELYSEMTSLGKEGVRLQPLKTACEGGSGENYHAEAACDRSRSERRSTVLTKLGAVPGKHGPTHNDNRNFKLARKDHGSHGKMANSGSRNGGA